MTAAAAPAGKHPRPLRLRVTAPVILGLSDGMMSLLGVILFLLGHQSLIFPAALMGGISSAISMAAGTWLSDSDDGLLASCAMGAATGIGGVLPSVPFAVARGGPALAASIVICALIGTLVAVLRQDRGTWKAFIETAVILAGVVGVVLLCNLVVPGGGA